jgi:putative membrane protein
MIVKKDVSWIGMLFTIRGSGWKRTYPRIAIITLFSVLVTYLETHADIKKFTLTATPFTLIGLALGIFLGFRNNIAYDRYWEGRKLWGSVVNASRSFARQALILVNCPSDRPEDQAAVADVQRTLIYRIIAFAHALRGSLRNTDPLADTHDLLSNAERASVNHLQNIPQAILSANGMELRETWQRGWISDLHLPVLEGTLKELTDFQGGCERIQNTPFPFVYSVLLHQIVAFYCFFLTFGIFDVVGLMTPVVVMLIAHAFFGLDEIGEEIEDPFGTQPNHLPLDAICRTIEINLRQQLGERDVPPPLRPINDLLL